MNTKPTLLVINGRPASGKSSLAERLSNDLKIPRLCKDEMKELLFDTLGYSDRDWSTKCNAPSYALVNLMAKKILTSRNSTIIESNFSPKFDSKKVNEVIKDTGAKVVQILCSADKDVLFERFKERALSGNRHPGHNDDNDFELAYKRHFSEEFIPLDLPGKLIEYNSTKLDDDRYRKLVEDLRSFIENDGAE